MILLKEVREEKGLSQVELANRSGVKQQTISIIESGERANPRIDTLYALAVTLGCEICDIWKPEEEERGNEDG